MLVRVSAMAQCLCLSVTSRCSVETDERIELVYRLSKRVIDLTRQDGRSERDTPDRFPSTKLTLTPSSDNRQLVYHSDHQAQFRPAGPLATADICKKSLRGHN